MESKPKREDLCGRALSLQLCCAAAVLCCAVRYVHAAGRWAYTAVCCCTTGMLLCSGVLCGVCCTSLLRAVLHLAVLCVRCVRMNSCAGWFFPSCLAQDVDVCMQLPSYSGVQCYATCVLSSSVRSCAV